jgi:hypothetical protein
MAAFAHDNEADLPPGSPGRILLERFDGSIDRIQTLAAQKVSGSDDFNRYMGLKEDALDTIKSIIRQMNLAANAVSENGLGIGDKYRRPRNRSEQNILATGRSFHADSAEHEALFIEHGMDGSFRTDLQAAIDAVESNNDLARLAFGSRAEATGALIDEFERASVIARKLKAFMQIKYRDDAGKLAAFTVASRLERPPVRAAGVRPENAKGEEVLAG